jgi:hypothetical protein
MPQESKTKQQDSKKENEQFTKLSDLTNEQVMKLPDVQVHLEKKIFKSGTSAVLMKVVFNELFELESSSMDTFDPLTEDTYRNILLKTGTKLLDERGRVRTQFNLPAKYRFVKGHNTDGKEYKSVEIIFKQYVYRTIYIKRGHQMENIEMMEKAGYISPNWHVRPDALSSSEMNNFEFKE